MEIVYFTLGVFTVLSIIGVVIVVRMTIAVRQLQEDLKDHERGTHDVAVDLHHRIDNEVRELQSNINENERDILSLLDSRLDKLASKINKQQLPKG